MGILQRRHLSTEGHVIASTLQQQVEDEADGMEMVANRLNAYQWRDDAEREEAREWVEFMVDSAARLRALVSDL